VQFGWRRQRAWGCCTAGWGLRAITARPAPYGGGDQRCGASLGVKGVMGENMCVRRLRGGGRALCWRDLRAQRSLAGTAPTPASPAQRRLVAKGHMHMHMR